MVDPVTGNVIEINTDGSAKDNANKALDPIVLNFSDHQVHTTSMATSSAHFDLDGTGAVHTGWITTDEGFLVLAPAAGQAITHGSQLIPTFATLAQMDTNHDGKLDSSDAGFANLRVWQKIHK